MTDLSLSEVAALVQATIDKHPDWVNPTFGPFCRYTSRDGKGHCIIGQVALENGWRVPAFEEIGQAPAVAIEMSWPISSEAASFLGHVQAIADDLARPHEEGLAVWGDIDITLIAQEMEQNDQ